MDADVWLWPGPSRLPASGSEQGVVQTKNMIDDHRTPELDSLVIAAKAWRIRAFLFHGYHHNDHRQLRVLRAADLRAALGGRGILVQQ